jgi:hypothetical protein
VFRWNLQCQPVRRVIAREECHWSHAWQRFKRSNGVKFNGTLEHEFLVEKRAPYQSAVDGVCLQCVDTCYGGNGKRWWTPEKNAIGHSWQRCKRSKGGGNSMTSVNCCRITRTAPPMPDGGVHDLLVRCAHPVKHIPFVRVPRSVVCRCQIKAVNIKAHPIQLFRPAVLCDVINAATEFMVSPAYCIQLFRPAVLCDVANAAHRILTNSPKECERNECERTNQQSKGV